MPATPPEHPNFLKVVVDMFRDGVVGPCHGWTYARFPRLSHFGRWRLRRWTREVYNRTGGSVFSGPFAGMELPESHPLVGASQFIIGSYEQEVHPFIIDRFITGHPQVVDIGADQGFYVVGLARHLPDAQIIGFEMDEGCYPAIRQLADANDVSDRIDLRGECTLNTLRDTLQPGAFVLCDCEGAELTLMDPDAVPALRQATILIELHDFYAPGTTAALLRRFRESHEIQILTESRRDPHDYRVLFGLPDHVARLLIQETRFIGRRKVTAGRFMTLTPRNALLP